MRKISCSIYAIIAICLTYLGFSFVMQDVSAASWTEDARATFILCSAWICIAVSAIYLEL